LEEDFLAKYIRKNLNLQNSKVWSW